MFAETLPQTESDRPETAVANGPPDPDWAWAPYVPDDQRPWNLARAAHLFRRGAFGANWKQLQGALADGPGETVEKLLRPEADVAAFNRSHDEYEGPSGSVESLRSWWLRRAIETPHPLLEKMTFFWHAHFALSSATVNNPAMIRQHVQLLRSHALGRFEPLLQAVSRDPATLVGLDSTFNRKSQPNPNYARNLMARYSLGLGAFSEQDVQEAARAFTGWAVLRNQLRYFDREHDTGVKKVLGQEGDFEGDDVVRIVLGQPAAPRFLIGKLYRHLVSETEEPSDELIAPLAKSFAQDYDVAKLVETMLRSNLFFSPRAYRQRVKSPVEFALGIAAGLEGIIPTESLSQDLAALGQNLYEPPTGNGWKGGRSWINRSTLPARGNLALALVSGSKPYGTKLDPAAVADKYGFSTAESAGRFIFDLFLQSDVGAGVPEALLETLDAGGEDRSQRLRRFTHSVLSLPEFQLA